MPEIEPRIETVEVLRKKLQIAIRLEFCTIPAYLSGWLTIKDRETYWEVSDTLLRVVVAEMKHLSIACNVLTAVGGRPDVLGAVPEYPMRLPDQNRDKLVRLLKFGPPYVDLGLFVEQPDDPKRACVDGVVHGEIDLSALKALDADDPTIAFLAETPVLDLGYRSIGAFYHAIIEGIDRLVKREGEAAVFPDGGRVERQYTHFGGQDNITVAGSGDATTLLRDIVDEGEGNGDRLWDENRELSHYYCFDELRKKKRYLSNDARCEPAGGEIRVPQGDEIVNIIADPKMSEYASFPEASKAAEEFNQQYTSLVANLHTGFDGHPQQIDTAIGQMHQLVAAAERVLACSLYAVGDLEIYAAPTFEIPPYSTETVQMPAAFQSHS